MRKRFNLDLQSLGDFSMLVHGDYNAGKTTLIGDMLRYERQFGEVRFVNIRGEDGSLSISGMGLGDSAEEVDTIDDFKAMMNDYFKTRFRALGLDSMKPLMRLVAKKVCKGSDRMPNEPAEWGQLHMEMELLSNNLRKAAARVLAVCPSDKSTNQISGATLVTPDLPGREAAGSAGWFDFVGYLSARVVGPGKVKRILTFTPNSQIVTRQRLPKPVVEDLEIPLERGGWEVILKAFEKSFEQYDKSVAQMLLERAEEAVK